jgi:uncharacterized protein YqeY
MLCVLCGFAVKNKFEELYRALARKYGPCYTYFTSCSVRIARSLPVAMNSTSSWRTIFNLPGLNETGMTSKKDLENDLKDAMRAHDELRKTTLRMALAAIKMAEIEKRATIDDTAVLSILQKEIKSRQEAIADAQKAGRPDLVAASQAEIGVLEKYLPQPFTPDELEALARQAISEVNATSAREMGQVMKVLMPRLAGRATGNQASQVVRGLLEA